MRASNIGEQFELKAGDEPRTRFNGWFYRSDQISFARVGVPAIWFKSGGDFIGREPGWGEQQYADWITYKYHTPGWYAGDEFEAVREAALKSLDN